MRLIKNVRLSQLILNSNFRWEMLFYACIYVSQEYHHNKNVYQHCVVPYLILWLCFWRLSNHNFGDHFSQFSFETMVPVGKMFSLMLGLSLRIKFYYKSMLKGMGGGWFGRVWEGEVGGEWAIFSRYHLHMTKKHMTNLPSLDQRDCEWISEPQLEASWHLVLYFHQAKYTFTK